VQDIPDYNNAHVSLPLMVSSDLALDHDVSASRAADAGIVNEQSLILSLTASDREPWNSPPLPGLMRAVALDDWRAAHDYLATLEKLPEAALPGVKPFLPVVNWPWLAYADSLAGLAVAGVILWVGSQLGRRTLDALLDAVPAGLQDQLVTEVGNIEGVLHVERVRLRRAGNRYFVDATVSVARTANLEQVHALTDRIEKRIAQIVPADVIVHAEPRAPRDEHLFESVRAVALRLGLAVHDVTASQQDGHLFVELHLEVDENLSLREAHRRATELEDGIRELGKGNVDVNIHIEPLGRHIATPDTRAGEMRQLEMSVESFLNGMPSTYDELINCHDVRVRQVEHHILVSCHCVMKSDLSITRVHDVTAALEDSVKERFPQISRVTIHPEPPDAS